MYPDTVSSSRTENTPGRVCVCVCWGLFPPTLHSEMLILRRCSADKRNNVYISVISFLACFPFSRIDVVHTLCESTSVSFQCSIPSFDCADGIKAFFMSLKPDVHGAS